MNQQKRDELCREQMTCRGCRLESYCHRGNLYRGNLNREPKTIAIRKPVEQPEAVKEEVN